MKFKPWKTISIFISSTFKDMNYERDYLIRNIIPKLEAKFSRQKIDIKAIDYRFGVNTMHLSEIEKESMVMKVCADTVINSRPFFVALLGGRYGWIPPEAKIKKTVKLLNEQDQLMLSNIEGKSITEIEILLGALGTGQLSDRCLFFFRSDDSYNAMSTDIKKEYVETEFEKVEKLESLKKHIAALSKNKNKPIYNYTLNWDGKGFLGLEKWGDIVYKAIYNEIEKELESPQFDNNITWEQQERENLDFFIESRVRGFIGREDILKQLQKKIIAENHSIIISTDSGQGKTSLFCKLYQTVYLQPDTLRIILAHSAGASPISLLPERMLQRWNYELCTILGIEYQEILEDIGGQSNINNPFHGSYYEAKEVSDHLRNVINQFAKLIDLALYKGFKILIMIDALDRFRETSITEYMQWLPANVTFFATTTPGNENNLTKFHQNIQIHSLPPFSRQDATLLINFLSKQYYKDLHLEVKNSLLDKKDINGNYCYSSPLWLSLALSVLITLDVDDFEQIRHLEDIDGEEQKIVKFMNDLVCDFPSDSGELFLDILQRSKSFFGEKLVYESIKYISLSLDGLREKDLSHLLGKDWDSLKFIALQRWLRQFLTEINGQWCISHILLKDAMLANNKENNKEKHSKLAFYLHSLPPEDALYAIETAYHMIEADMKIELVEFYNSVSETKRHLTDKIFIKYFICQKKEIKSFLISALNTIAPSDAVKFGYYLILSFGRLLKRLGMKVLYTDFFTEVIKIADENYDQLGIEFKRGLGRICTDVSLYCKHLRKMDDLLLISLVQLKCYEDYLLYCTDEEDRSNIKSSITIARCNIGDCYLEKGDAEKAFEYYQ